MGNSKRFCRHRALRENWRGAVHGFWLVRRKWSVTDGQRRCHSCFLWSQAAEVPSRGLLHLCTLAMWWQEWSLSWWANRREKWCSSTWVLGRKPVEWKLIQLSVLVAGDRKNGVTYIKYKRFLQTNEPINDQAIPSDREVNVIAAIGPLNSRNEANAHSLSGGEFTADDVKIDFSSKDEHSCKSSLYERKDESSVKPWPSRKLIGENIITARIGPTGGKRGYTAITGEIFTFRKFSSAISCLNFWLNRFPIMGHCLVLEWFADSWGLRRTRADIHVLGWGRKWPNQPSKVSKQMVNSAAVN